MILLKILRVCVLSTIGLAINQNIFADNTLKTVEKTIYFTNVSSINPTSKSSSECITQLGSSAKLTLTPSPDHSKIIEQIITHDSKIYTTSFSPVKVSNAEPTTLQLQFTKQDDASTHNAVIIEKRFKDGSRQGKFTIDQCHANYKAY